MGGILGTIVTALGIMFGKEMKERSSKTFSVSFGYGDSEIPEKILNMFAIRVPSDLLEAYARSLTFSLKPL